MMPDHTLQRTRPSRSGCNRGVPWAGSLSLGRSATIHRISVVPLLILAVIGCESTRTAPQGLFGDPPRKVPYSDNVQLQHIYLTAYWNGLKGSVESKSAGSRHFDDFFAQTPEEIANAKGYWDADEDAERMMNAARAECQERLKGVVDEEILKLLRPHSIDE